jgi:CBS domain-containing protein
MLLKKGVGLLGQFLTETHGPHSGLLNIKEKALYPYVNAVRILALKECITDSSTLSRLQKLSEASIPASKRLLYEKQFYQLLDFRLQFGDHSNYDSGHFLLVSKLSAHQKKAVKEVIKNGPHLYQFVRKLVEKEP